MVGSAPNLDAAPNSFDVAPTPLCAQATASDSVPSRATKAGAGKVVLLDYYFNREYQQGRRFHYTWEDESDAGYAQWGRIFRDLGATIDSLPVAPTHDNLRRAQVYIIVDPDTPKETPQPHFLEPAHIDAIRHWVEKGGTLVLLANDTSNCEISRFNQLAKAFGMRFSERNRNKVINNQYEQGAVRIPAGHSVFRNASKLFIKDLSVLSLRSPARPLLADGQDILMATASVGKGRVFALGDPWLYNEYLAGKRLPADYENTQAARDLAHWLLAPAPTATANERAVEKAVESLRQAMLDGDRAALAQIAHPQLSYGHSSGKVEDRASFVETLATGKSNFTELLFSDVHVALSGKTATVRHFLIANTHDAGKAPGTVQLAVLLVWVKEAGQWRLLARQAVKY